MKKIPTLFVRKFENHKVIDITDKITLGCEKAFKEGIATIKFDGSCCAIINGEFYKRYDCKKGKIPPEGAIPCCEPDRTTGHWPHWVKIDPNNSADKWFRHAFYNTSSYYTNKDGTYEAIGRHFNGNPYNYKSDTLIRHGQHHIVNLDRDFNSIKRFLEESNIEGIVFWLDGEPVCKIKRTDFGLQWPVD